MAERIELIFTMETVSPVLDGSPDSFVGQSTMYLPLLVKNVPRSTYVAYLLTTQSTISSIRFHILLFVFSRRRFTDVQTADDGIHTDVALLPIRCCIVVVLWYFQN